ncbi:MAG: hypothetical protein MJ220_02370 [Bacilli bacterium]|nr:hypothetical protein [Bacilli bacterium]
MYEFLLNKHITDVINAAFDCHYEKDDELTRFALTLFRGSSGEDLPIYQWVDKVLESGDFTIKEDFLQFAGNKTDLGKITQYFAAVLYDKIRDSHAEVLAISRSIALSVGEQDYYVSRDILIRNEQIHREYSPNYQVSFKAEPVLRGPLESFLDENENERVIEAFNYAPFVRFDLCERHGWGGFPEYTIYHVMCRDESGKTYILTAPASEAGFDPLNSSIGNLFYEDDHSETSD